MIYNLPGSNYTEVRRWLIENIGPEPYDSGYWDSGIAQGPSWSIYQQFNSSLVVIVDGRKLRGRKREEFEARF